MRIFLQSMIAILLLALGAAGGFLAATLHLPLGTESQAAKEDAAPASAAKERRILYYRNPMGLPDTSPVPKKDEMGMDYIPVYEDEDASDSGIVKISVEKVQKAGVSTERVARRVMAQAISAPATLQIDERRVQVVSLRFEGFVEEVYANAAGEGAKAGQRLFRVYSPEVSEAAASYRAAKDDGERQAGVRRLRNLAVPDQVIEAIPGSDRPLGAFDWPSPASGVILSKTIAPGSRVMPGDELYRIADVSSLWARASVAEGDVGRVRVGDEVSLSFPALAGRQMTGRIILVEPQLKAETRTAQAIIEVPNPDRVLLSGMLANATISSGESRDVVAVPESAVIESGKRQIVITEIGAGRFKPVEVKLGRRDGNYAEVLEGLSEGESIVTRATFLIDAESNLQAALTALTNAAEAAQ
jgi:Cu(I)/Ag(I) efflux system membrane fusion protein